MVLIPLVLDRVVDGHVDVDVDVDGHVDVDGQLGEIVKLTICFLVLTHPCEWAICFFGAHTSQT